MERRGVTPVVTPTTEGLEDVLTSPGPFVSVYLTTEAAVEHASSRSQRRWNVLRDELAGAGADEPALAAVDPWVRDAHEHGECLAVVARRHGVLHVEYGPDPPRRDLGRWAPLPSLGPLLEWRQLSPPHLIVLIDRRGADLVAVTRQMASVREVAGDPNEPITKVAPGGWSQRRYQQRAEHTWERNAGTVADEVVRLCDKIDARLVVVAGDVRAVHLLREALPGRVERLVRVIEGGRAPGTADDAEAAAITRLTASVAAEETTALLRKLREELGQHDRAVQGPAATLEALARKQVEVLLVHDDPDDPRTAWCSPEPLAAAGTRDDLETMGITEPVEARLVDVAVRVALGSGATVRLVPGAGPMEGGIGAILRWAQSG
jgi:Bacterial archaeo-eukaryotic release factor family 2